MLVSQIGPSILFGLGLAYASYGVRQLVQAYRIEPFDEWTAKALSGAVGIMIGALFAWSGYWLEGHT